MGRGVESGQDVYGRLSSSDFYSVSALDASSFVDLDACSPYFVEQRVLDTRAKDISAICEQFTLSTESADTPPAEVCL